MHEAPSKLLVYLASSSRGSASSPSDAIESNLGADTLVEFTKTARGAAWRLLTLHEDRVPMFVKAILPAFNLIHVGAPQAGESFTLTEKEALVVRAALARGYYELPKSSSVDDLARELALPRSTVQHNLQRAEAKLMRSALTRG